MKTKQIILIMLALAIIVLSTTAGAYMTNHLKYDATKNEWNIVFDENDNPSPVTIPDSFNDENLMPLPRIIPDEPSNDIPIFIPCNCDCEKDIDQYELDVTEMQIQTPSPVLSISILEQEINNPLEKIENPNRAKLIEIPDKVIILE